METLMNNDWPTVGFVPAPAAEPSPLGRGQGAGRDRQTKPESVAKRADSRDPHPGPLSAGEGVAPLRVRSVDRADELPTLATDWNRWAGTIPFRRYEWLETWWRHYATANTRLFVLVVEDAAGQIVGLAPWHITSTTSQGRVIRFLGSGEVCSEYLTLLAQPGHEISVAAAVAQWLAGAGAGTWDLIEMEHVPADDVALNALNTQCAALGSTVHHRPGMNCWSVSLPSTWDEFLAGLTSSRRAKIRQSLRKFFAAGKVETHELTDPAEFERRFAMMVDLHQRRRQSLGQPGCFASAAFLGFHREVSRRLFDSGNLRLIWTQLAGKPIAVEYALVGGRTVYYYQTGLEPDAIDVGPGWLGMIGSLRHAIDGGCRKFDFLRGDEPYKMSWGAEARPTVRTRIVAQRPAAKLRHAIWLAQDVARRWVKRRLQPAPAEAPVKPVDAE